MNRHSTDAHSTPLLQGLPGLFLGLARHLFQSFAVPESQGWLRAMHLAEARFGPDIAGPLCFDLVASVQAMRQCRSGVFRFSNPDCPCCRDVVTPHERLLLSVLHALENGRADEARAHAVLLCEGAEPAPFLAVAARLVARHAALPCPPRGKSGPMIRR